MPTIILSYRREDSAWVAGRIHDRLKAYYGADNVFMDIDSIPFGLDFREHIHNSLERCDILIAIIGPHWAAPNEQGQPKICEESDWVRIEIEAALAKKVPVIPVLVDGTKLPPARDLPDGVRDLVYRQAADVNSGRDFHPHMDQLIEVMDQLLALLGRAASPAPDVSAQGTGPRDPKTAPAKKEPSRTLSSHEPFQSTAAKLLDVPSESRTREAISRTGNPLWLGLKAILTPPTGRISRKVFWIAIVESVLCIAVAVALYGAILGSLGLTLDSEMWSGGLAVLMLSAWTWSTAAVGGKRLHDRDRPAGWIAVPIAWQVLTSLQVAANSSEDVKGVVGIVGLAIGLWVLIDLGLLKGTQGPNRYGPDPLGKRQADATL